MIESRLKKFSVQALFFSFVILFANINCYAEGAGDYFLYDVSKLPKDILINTIGMISYSIEEIEMGIQQYEHKKNNFVFKNIIQFKKTQPVGIGGYEGWCKYLVVATDGEYIKIVYNPYQNSQAWVKPTKKSVNKHTLIIFDKLIGKDLKPKKVGEIDIFILSKEIKLYKEPKKNSNYVLIKKGFQERRVFYPISISKGFIQIGEEFFNEDSFETTYGKPIGWIKTRNDDGAIAFYLYTCFWL